MFRSMHGGTKASAESGRVPPPAQTNTVLSAPQSPATAQALLDEYAQLAQLTAQMRQAAEAGEWAQLSVIEQRCGVHIAALQSLEGAVELSPCVRKAKFDHLRRIFADDRKIRDLSAPWMRRLAQLLQPAGKQRQHADACTNN